MASVSFYLLHYCITSAKRWTTGALGLDNCSRLFCSSSATWIIGRDLQSSAVKPMKCLPKQCSFALALRISHESSQKAFLMAASSDSVFVKKKTLGYGFCDTIF